MSLRTTIAIAALGLVAAAGWYQALKTASVGQHQPGVSSMSATGMPAAAVEQQLIPATASAPAPARSTDEELGKIFAMPDQFSRDAALHAFAAARSASSLQVAIREAASLDDPRGRSSALLILLKRLAELDPGRALATLRRLDLGAERYALVRVLFEHWARANAGAAIVALSDLSDAQMVQAGGDGILLAHVEPGKLINDDVLRRLPAGFHPGPALAARLGLDAERDPQAAALQALSLTDAVLRRGALHTVADIWALADPHQALGFVARMGDPVNRWHLEHVIIERWVATDATALIDAIDSAFSPERRMPLLKLAFHEITQHDPLLALSYLESRSAYERSQLQSQVYTIWASSDFPAAFTHIESGMAASARQQVIGNMIYRYAEDAPLDALHWALSRPAPERSVFFQRAVQGALQEGGADVAGFLAGLDEDARETLNLAGVVNMLAAQDPELAMELLDQVPQPRQPEVLASIADAFARRDRVAAIEWADSLEPDQRDSALHGVVRVWIQEDPAEAFAFVLRQPYVPEFMYTVIEPYARLDPAAAFEGLRLLGDKTELRSAMSRVVGIWAQSDPRAAAQGVTLMTDERSRSLAMQRVMSAWAERSPREAAEWLGAIADTSVAENAVASVARTWASTDQQQALGWAAQLQPQLRNAALRNIAAIASYKNPLGGINIANQIDSDDARFEAVREVMMHVRNHPTIDPTEALDLAQLSPERRAELAEQINTLDPLQR